MWSPTAAKRSGPPEPPPRPARTTCPAWPSATTRLRCRDERRRNRLRRDLWATRITPGQHPVVSVREHLDHIGAVPAGRVLDVEDGTRISVGGAITHMQRPAAGGGITFVNLEDETGTANVIVSVGMFHRTRRTLQNNAVVVRVIAQVSHGQCPLRPTELHRWT